MAVTRQKPRKLGIASMVWLAVAAALLLAMGLLAWKLAFGKDYRQLALDDAQRIEFSLAYQDGNAMPQALVGETLSLETAKAMAAAHTATAKQPEAVAPEAGQPAAEPVPEAAAEPEAEATPPPPPAEPEPVSEPAVEPSPAPAPEPQPAAEQTGQETTAAQTPPAQQEPPQTTAPPPPDLAPVETMTDKGVIPAIAADGTKPWQYFANKGYAKDADKPRIAVVVSGLGLARLSTEAAIALPAQVSLSFSPYGREATASLAEAARKAGHETLLDLPMQTARYPAVDPGPYGLRTDLTAAENYDRLMTVLTKARGYVGLLAPARDVITLDRSLTALLIDGFAQQGLLFVSGYSQQPEGMFRLTRQAGVPILFTDVELDSRVNETYIRNQLARAEDIAHNNGKALIVAHDYPLTLELLGEWLSGLAAKGYTLVPVSALGMEGG